MTEVQYFNGIRFALTKGNKYFINTPLHETMHRYVWKYYNGEIPEGYEVHHKDFNRHNNDISNLELLTSNEHKKLHAKSLTDEQREWRRNNMNVVARPKAVEWHKSDEGRAWHKRQVKTRKDGRRNISNVCVQCHREFISYGTKSNKFCSGACAQQYRRDNKLDMVDATCVICGKKFMTNKSRPAKTCGKSCGNKLSWRTSRA